MIPVLSYLSQLSLPQSKGSETIRCYNKVYLKVIVAIGNVSVVAVNEYVNEFADPGDAHDHEQSDEQPELCFQLTDSRRYLVVVSDDILCLVIILTKKVTK
jgi:hypothetical protein